MTKKVYKYCVRYMISLDHCNDFWCGACRQGRGSCKYPSQEYKEKFTNNKKTVYKLRDKYNGEILTGRKKVLYDYD